MDKKDTSNNKLTSDNKTVNDKSIKTVPVPLVDTYSKRDSGTNK